MAGGAGRLRHGPRTDVGEVTLDGQPLKIGLLALTPIDRGAGTSTGGEIVDGHYSIAAAKGPKRGLEYSVSISSVDRTGARPHDIVPNLIPPEYNEKTTLRVNVPQSGGLFEHNFTLTH